MNLKLTFQVLFCPAPTKLQPNLIHDQVCNELTEVVTFAQFDRNVLQFIEDLNFPIETVRELRPGEYAAMELRSGRLQFGNIFTEAKLRNA